MSSVPSSSRPSSPTKPGVSLHESLKPNPHPYAIKTTSTGILSRSATTSPSVSHSQNHYVPLSPSPSPTKSTHSDYERRGSRHRYSRSLTDEIPRPLPVPPEELYYQQQHGHGHARSRAETLPTHMSDPSANPKTWTYEQLAQNVPEIADFVNENEITGRAFLRFDEGVLNAVRSDRAVAAIAPPLSLQTASDYDASNGGLSHSHSLSDSPTKSRPLTLDEEEDQAYLSSSSISSTSSLSGRRRRRYRPNGRVHGMVASFERSSSVDEGPRHRERSGSISSVESSDEPYIYQPQPQSTAGRPLPYPRTHTHMRAKVQVLEARCCCLRNGAYVTPHATGIGNGSNTTSTNGQRPLPALPTHPSLRSSPFEADHPSADYMASPDIQGDGERKNTSGEMTMDELLAVLNADAAADEKDASAASPRSSVLHTTGAAAWEMDFGLGETVKRAPASAPPAQAQAQAAAVGEDELTVEELLALEGAGAGAGMGAAAWVDEPEGVSARAQAPAREGEGMDRISLSKGRMGKKQGRQVGELFTVEGGMEDAVGGVAEKATSKETEEMELERDAGGGERLLSAEEEERERWCRQEEKEREEARRRLEEEERQILQREQRHVEEGRRKRTDGVSVWRRKWQRA
ncbi:hypothetical protein LshimejAT787_1800560 [Lyophyllum shimeji]|uniref:Uncharacterized protein n=1 Tax=Lyophyllum shimeji TaxID=47721 RepID=A0A9P3Q024_LYOSH|nr:hypothetical protein LshimejAT787_1800560 [Lyophyllum shimeji]